MAKPDPTIVRLRSVMSQLESMTVASLERTQQMKKRIKQLKRALDSGLAIPDAVAAEARPLLTELITANIEALQEIGADFRRAEVAALRAEGLTMEQIAGLLGVTRQRVSAIIKADSAS